MRGPARQAFHRQGARTLLLQREAALSEDAEQAPLTRSRTGKLHASRGIDADGVAPSVNVLANEYEGASALRDDRLKKADALTLISDGWSGVQKYHVLSVLLTTPHPSFIDDIFSKDASVTAEYQTEICSKTINDLKENASISSSRAYRPSGAPRTVSSPARTCASFPSSPLSSRNSPRS